MKEKIDYRKAKERLQKYYKLRFENIMRIKKENEIRGLELLGKLEDDMNEWVRTVDVIFGY